MKFKVIIVEDDPMVSSINRKYLESFNEVSVKGEFRNGIEALEYLRNSPVDLVVLDNYMPVMSGRELIIACHDERIFLDFIMITAANQAAEISDIVHLGVVDYLVKPFTRKRFRTAISRYLEIKEFMRTSTGRLTQDEIDRILDRNAPARREENLEKGLQKKTFERIHVFLQEHKGQEFTSNQVANAVGLSRITVRKYMNYLLAKEEIVSRVDYLTGGRPAIKYSYVPINEPLQEKFAYEQTEY